MLKKIDKNNFADYVKDGIKFIAFTAPWCGYCRKQKPVLEEIASKSIEAGEVNADDNPEITAKYDIHAFPSFLLFKEGKLIGKFSGYRPNYDLLNIIMHYLK